MRRRPAGVSTRSKRGRINPVGLNARKNQTESRCNPISPQAPVAQRDRVLSGEGRSHRFDNIAQRCWTEARRADAPQG